ncbi:MAG TPA: type 1 glutamine amidotransferase [Spirochaetota bacterium]|nr:type 1 glutamine amidotransferase [Spirochaetota bacterium]HPC40188.1 type 1 glutamine amidotransferase [Spirochaetota bacterium]HPL16168.1 type 1 glutamine amidotransferase [Spirochaetota bacterium]HQF07338.1 type 1 glutamine amidotransferase [Spirochaetota bacterium]HQH96239.1 type 1 glutamine amidotransferase [Spirochaetota bacterium]
MARTHRILIIDGYPKPSRDEFDVAGMKGAGILYAEMLLRYLPGAAHDILYTSDPGVTIPTIQELSAYDGVLWPGCNLTVYHTDDERVKPMLALCDRAFEAGLPQFGTCWGIQLPAFVAGGEVKANPKGREMGIGRKIRLTEAGKKHPMMKGKPEVYNHFVSHDDEVTRLPEGSVLLSGNDFSRVQAAEIRYKKGVFWGLQYHPEYDLHEMARLMVAREKKLTELGFFRGHGDFQEYVDRLEALNAEPQRKDLRWQLGIDDDILSADIRQCEFRNWVDTFILGT